jgi:hypothetical protein
MHVKRRIADMHVKRRIADMHVKRNYPKRCKMTRNHPKHYKIMADKFPLTADRGAVFLH